ncbi:hypothetical protein [Corallococcus macrosporus]|uniref:hypothetical protein n=1 Tax=Corallococcus macrosporus TaxID=35 RepID=UPI0011D2B17C|nr:hypothetical protein [Corallococcus macrosporus]
MPDGIRWSQVALSAYHWRTLAWVTCFATWKNTEHRHSATHFVTPDDRQFGRETVLLARRHQVYQGAEARHPERWNCDTRDWIPAGPVRTTPGSAEVEAHRLNPHTRHVP